jgi:hypothetical protein
MGNQGETFEDILAELMDDEDFAALFDCLPPAAPNPFTFPSTEGLTEKQLRAMSKKHLLMIIYDLEEELRLERLERREKEILRRAR